MPTKKPSLFDVSGNEPPKEKKPTLRQYLKENADIVYPEFSGVEIVWFPGNWENYSVGTSRYRASIAPTHTLYKTLDALVIKVFLDSETQILLAVEDATGTIRFSESNVYGKYERIGNAGLRWVPTPGAN